MSKRHAQINKQTGTEGIFQGDVHTTHTNHQLHKLGVQTIDKNLVKIHIHNGQKTEKNYPPTLISNSHELSLNL